MSASAAGAGFVSSLQGMRAVAAIGVLTTHVAFQTGMVGTPVLGPVLGRLDLAVAVFFALSGFLLWRPHAEVAHGTPGTRAPGLLRYARHRVIRIWPAYLVVVVVALLLLPDARGDSSTVWLANLTLTQIYVPLTLTAGLTQMWSLAVEVSFYLVLPFAAVAMRRLHGPRARWRTPLVLVVGLLAFAWAPISEMFPLTPGVSAMGWLPGHLPWFVAGVLLAEVVAARDSGRRPTLLVRFGARRGPMAVVAVAAYAAACTPLAGPTGLGAVSAAAFVGKIALGAVLAFALLAPLVLATTRHRLLDSAAMQALGRWSYGIFIWHLVMLSAVFSLFGIVPFDGSMPLVWVLTALLSTGIAAASYGLVEEPARLWLSKREAHRRTDARTSITPETSAARQPTKQTATSAGN